MANPVLEDALCPVRHFAASLQLPGALTKNEGAENKRKGLTLSWAGVQKSKTQVWAELVSSGGSEGERVCVLPLAPNLPGLLHTSPQSLPPGSHGLSSVSPGFCLL